MKPPVEAIIQEDISIELFRGHYHRVSTLNLQRHLLKAVRKWKNVEHYDIAGERLVYSAAVSLSQIYSMPLR